MKRHYCLGLLLAGSLCARAQEEVNLDDVLSAAQQWAQENLDENALRSLADVDQAKVKALFAEIQKRFQGQYVIDLAPLKDAASAVLPILEGSAPTRPYAEWLRARLDYLDVANEFRLTIPPPKVEPGQPPKPVPNPAPAVERRVWRKELAQRPVPTGAAAYAARLKPVFASQHVPPELVWVAEVESAFKPTARSPVGAAGLYQLMPATAQQMGLELRPEDERLQPEKSARAAAKYLNYLYGRFGDWPLALAAYNAGEGNVHKLLGRYKAKSFDGIATHLPAETQMYVPKIEATVLRREGLALAQLKRP